jgi:hypothetical protein
MPPCSDRDPTSPPNVAGADEADHAPGATGVSDGDADRADAGGCVVRPGRDIPRELLEYHPPSRPPDPAALLPYPYGPTPWVVGSVETAAGRVPRVGTALTSADRLGGWRVRWNIGRSRYRVAPGLYAVGTPDSGSPVLATANYKLTFDALRRELTGLDAWILVVETYGVNVWCAAGKGTFSTAELARRVRAVRLADVVNHGRLIVPQLGASGVAGHELRRACGFSATFGPVRARDVPAFLAAGMRATPEMRRVLFPFRDRAVLIPVELSLAWRWQVLAGTAVIATLLGIGGRPFSLAAYGLRLALVYGSLLVSLLAGAVVVPLALPWLPGRAFAAKGALVGGLLAAASVVALRTTLPPLALAALFLAVSAGSSYVAMNFTGSTPFTSPSGVGKEMRRWLPWQIGGAGLAVLLLLAEGVLKLLKVDL